MKPSRLSLVIGLLFVGFALLASALPIPFTFQDQPAIAVAVTLPTGQSKPTGWALRFDGDVTHYGNVGTNALLHPQTAMTFELWYRRTATLGNVAPAGTYNGTNGYVLNIADDQPYFLIFDNGEMRTVNGTNSVNDGIWHHLAGVWTGTQIKVFVDGVLQGTSSCTTNPSIAGSELPLLFGRENTGTLPADCDVTQIRLSDNARYSATFVPPISYVNDGNTIGLWACQEGTGTNLTDGSSNGLNATLLGDTPPSWVAAQP